MGSGPLDSRLIVAPRGVSFASELPGDKRGVSWTNRYGYVGISLVVDQIIGEGMNEAGLNAGLFDFPGYGSDAPGVTGSSRIRSMAGVSWLKTRHPGNAKPPPARRRP